MKCERIKKVRVEKPWSFYCQRETEKINTSDKANEQTFFALIAVCGNTNCHFNEDFNQMTLT